MRKFRDILSVLVIITLVLSLASNYYYITNQRDNKDLLKINLIGYTRSINSLEDMLNKLSNQNSTNPLLLVAAIKYTNETSIFADQINSLAGYVNKEEQEYIAKGRFYDISNFMTDLNIKLENQMQSLLKSNNLMDRNFLLNKANSLKLAKYPKQNNATIENISKSNIRLLK